MRSESTFNYYLVCSILAVVRQLVVRQLAFRVLMTLKLHCKANSIGQAYTAAKELKLVHTSWFITILVGTARRGQFCCHLQL